ncbi:hypothetical protein T01_5075 [Trichinella spiralis]|uniref:Uncharacterized protein n=1 Tax=Trichinella spiralis TaxID=6334 RepID=A0A0V0YNG1_TRISP|nr:hypothetical protein T01_5075 [Trichinella spiralis]
MFETQAHNNRSVSINDHCQHCWLYSTNVGAQYGRYEIQLALVCRF